MNYAMVKRLTLKDWYLQRWMIIACFAGGVASLGIIALGSNLSFYVGLLLLITALIAIGAHLAVASIVGERKDQTLVFVMSLPVSYREYTTSKILGTLLVFLVLWIPLVLGSLALLLYTPKTYGLVPYFLIMATEILVSTCLIAAVAVMTESQGWTVGAMMVGNVALNVVGYLVAHVSGVSKWMWGTSIRWTPAAWALLLGEFALIGLLVGITFYCQSRKSDFV